MLYNDIDDCNGIALTYFNVNVDLNGKMNERLITVGDTNRFDKFFGVNCIHSAEIWLDGKFSWLKALNKFEKKYFITLRIR